MFLTREGLTTRGATQQQRHLTVGHRLLGQIVVNDHSVLASVTEPLSLCVCTCVCERVCVYALNSCQQTLCSYMSGARLLLVNK